MTDRGEEIERFYWLLMRMIGLVFGYLMVAGGGLFALSFLVEKLRTGAVSIGGAAHSDAAMVAKLLAIPVLVALAGWALVAWIRRRSAEKSDG